MQIEEIFFQFCLECCLLLSRNNNYPPLDFVRGIEGRGSICQHTAPSGYSPQPKAEETKWINTLGGLSPKHV